MTLGISLVILAILALQGVAAWLTAAETSLTAVSKARVHLLAEEGSRRAVAVSVLIADRERMNAAVLLAKSFVLILATALAVLLAVRLSGDGAFATAAAVMTIMVLVLCEILPRTLAVMKTEQIALAAGSPMRVVVDLLSPIVLGAQTLVWSALKGFGVRGSHDMPALTAHEELRDTIDLHHQEGSVEREQRDMLGGVLDLRELQVADVMVHRRNMVVIDADAAVEDSVELVLSSGHTRYPIWKDDPENIVGVLHIKDLLRLLSHRRGALEGLDIMALAVPPWFVPNTTTLDEQVHAFQQRRAHFALVVDEYGTLQGLVTLEDILEEVFGDISEARDTHAPEGIRPQPDGSYVVDGWTPIRDLNRELEWHLPDEEATTVAGLVIHDARIIPEAGQIFSFHRFKFEVLRRQRNQVTALRITPPRKPGIEAGGLTAAAPLPRP